MKGEETEKILIEREYATLVKHENQVLTKRWWFGCVEEGIVSRGRFTLRVDPAGMLRQEWASNAKEPRQTPIPVPLVRCP